MSDPAEPLLKSRGGPLEGEAHCQGESFDFDGHYLDLPSGTYRLIEDVYRWEPWPEN